MRLATPLFCVSTHQRQKYFYLFGVQQFLLVLLIQTRDSLHWLRSTTTQSLSWSASRTRWYSWDPCDWSSSSWVSYSEKTTRERNDGTSVSPNYEIKMSSDANIMFYFFMYELRELLSVLPPERSCLGWRPPPADSSVGLDTIAAHLEDREQPIREQTGTQEPIKT